jgi:hypothetical protein
MNGFTYPVHWDATQHDARFRSAERYGLYNAIRMADGQRRADRRTQGRRLIRGSIRLALGPLKLITGIRPLPGSTPTQPIGDEVQPVG